MDPLVLDVRHDLKEGREPLKRILQTIKQLPAGQGLLLKTTFEPIPLYRVLGLKGLAHEARRLDINDWEILFSPKRDRKSPPTRNTKAANEPDDQSWPSPRLELDNRGLMPPEPMMHILEALEGLQSGEVLSAINDREPLFLYPELEARGHAIRIDRLAGGATHLLIRVGSL